MENELEGELRVMLDAATGKGERLAIIIILAEIAARQIDRLNAALGEPTERAQAETRLPHAKFDRLLRDLEL